MKNICFLITSLEAGGTEKYLLRFLNNYKNEISATVICKSGKAGILSKEFEEVKATILPITLGYFNPIGWLKCYNIFRKNDIETVCDFTGNFAGFYLAVAKLSGVQKRIAFYRRSSHAFKHTKLRTLYDRFANKMVFNNATNILANSHFGLDFFYPGRSLNDDRFEVVINGIDSKKFTSTLSKEQIRKELNIPLNSFIIGHTGRLNSAKNHIAIMRIAEKIVKKNDNIYFLFCGKGTVDLKDQTDSELLKKRLILLGFRPDVSRILKALDLYIFPSITEGQPNALIEAMISGLPFLASNIEPIKEVVPSELRHYLQPPSDVDGFSELIEKVYNNAEALEKLRCKEFAINRFDSKKNFKKLFELL